MNATPDAVDPARVRRGEGRVGQARSTPARIWYRLVQQSVLQLLSVSGGIRATGRENIPESGGVLLISNHLSHLDVFVLGLLLRRNLNYVARSTLFTPFLGPLIRSVGGFPIQREGSGAQGFKESMKRLRSGAIVTFFPEGTRSRDGELGELKPGIAALASRAGVPIVPAGLAGTFEAWPRSSPMPRPRAIRVHYGEPIAPESLEGLDSEAVLKRLGAGLRDSVAKAREGLRRDLQQAPGIEVGGSDRIR